MFGVDYFMFGIYQYEVVGVVGVFVYVGFYIGLFKYCSLLVVGNFGNGNRFVKEIGLCFCVYFVGRFYFRKYRFGYVEDVKQVVVLFQVFDII